MKPRAYLGTSLFPNWLKIWNFCSFVSSDLRRLDFSDGLAIYFTFQLFFGPFQWSWFVGPADEKTTGINNTRHFWRVIVWLSAHQFWKCCFSFYDTVYWHFHFIGLLGNGISKKLLLLKNNLVANVQWFDLIKLMRKEWKSVCYYNMTLKTVKLGYNNHNFTLERTKYCRIFVSK